MKKMSINKSQRLQKRLPNKIRFFEPFVGKHYTDGIKGKKILVLDSGSRCNFDACPNYLYCTNILAKNSRPYEKKCPRHKPSHRLLSLEPTYCIEDNLPHLQQLTTYLGKILEENDYNVIWSHVAYTNYVQYMLPSSALVPEVTWSHLTEYDFNAFIEVLEELKPNIVVVLGDIVAKRLQVRNPFLVDAKELENPISVVTVDTFLTSLTLS